jgi:hypothetical protein
MEDVKSEEKEKAYTILGGKHSTRKSFCDPGYGSIILKWTLNT